MFLLFIRMILLLRTVLLRMCPWKVRPWSYLLLEMTDLMRRVVILILVILPLRLQFVTLRMVMVLLFIVKIKTVR